jgi:hypothetical protein
MRQNFTAMDGRTRVAANVARAADHPAAWRPLRGPGATGRPLLEEEVLQVIERVPAEDHHHDALASLHLAPRDIAPGRLPLCEDLFERRQPVRVDRLVQAEDLGRLDQPALLSVVELLRRRVDLGDDLVLARGGRLLLCLSGRRVEAAMSDRVRAKE